MLKLSFDGAWLKTIMICVTSVSFSFNINRVVKGHVVPQRGIWQGDPFSHFLFLFCSKGLSCLLKEWEMMGSINGGEVRPE